MEKDNKNRELNDEELENVTGGENFSLHFCDNVNEVTFIFFPGNIIKVKKYFFSKTVRCRVLETRIFDDPQYHCYVDNYHVETIDYKNGDFYYMNSWISRDDIVNEFAD